MGSVTLLMVAKDEKESRRLARDIRNASRQSMSRSGGQRAALESFMLQSIRRLDRNNDGKVSADEVPQRFKRYLDRYDTNKDGALDEKEMEAIGNDTGGRRRER